METVTFQLKKEYYLPLPETSPFRDGAFIYLNPDSYRLFIRKLKPRFMVARLTKVQFRPKLGVFSVDSSTPYQHKITLKPINF